MKPAEHKRQRRRLCQIRRFRTLNSVTSCFPLAHRLGEAEARIRRNLEHSHP